MATKIFLDANVLIDVVMNRAVFVEQNTSSLVMKGIIHTRRFQSFLHLISSK